jgi:2',3'-cyclic-nucleotide 2'-phosphodiesterase (5'-nucleotidase family)
MRFSLAILIALPLPLLACDDCTSTKNEVVQTRLVRRMQPDAKNATSMPRGPLAWGQINFLHTTDTHGWLEGHLKEPNYGADWGDFVSFTNHMKRRAISMGVDLLIVDSGDLHDGAGLSDATSSNGLISNPVFENIDYDLLTIGNHELYVSSIAYEHFYQFAKVYGDRYLTSNVEIYNPLTGKLEYIGKQYRYFTTKMGKSFPPVFSSLIRCVGLRIMAFGVLFDFTGNSNASVITTAAKMVTQQWFINAVNYTKSIDMFIVLGHNPAGRKHTVSTFPTVYQAIRKIKPDTPITFFGGHLHVRDTMVYDNKTVSFASGRLISLRSSTFGV